VSEAIESSISAPAAELLKALSADALRCSRRSGSPPTSWIYSVGFAGRTPPPSSSSETCAGARQQRARTRGSSSRPEGFARSGKARRTRSWRSPSRAETGLRVRVAVSSVPLKNADGAMIGSFGLFQFLTEVEPSFERAPRLSAPRTGDARAPRCRLLDGADGADDEHLQRNRAQPREGVLRSLGARSRVEAVAKARAAGLV